MEQESSLEARFDAAVGVIRSLPEDGPYQPSDNMMLMFYSYYKQATLGPCHAPRPIGFWDSRGKAKWDAWSSLGNMTKEEAMINYVDDIQLILETIPVSEEVSELVEKLGNFYSEVDGAGDQVEQNEVDKRAFTRPFADCADELRKPKPLMEGFGDLWEDIQNPGNDRDATNDLCLAICDGDMDKHNNREHMAASNEDIQNNSLAFRNKESSDSEFSDVEGSSNGDDTEDEDEDQVDEEEAKGGPERRRTPFPGLQVWEEGRWSVSSMDPSMSSVTNGIHSSLNSQLEDEELASLQPHAPRSSNMRVNGRQSDNSGAIPEKNHRTADSDNEEFCDSMEHLAMEESSGFRKTSGRRREDVKQHGQPLLEYEFGTVRTPSSLTRRGRGSVSPRTFSGSQLCVNMVAACQCVSARGHSGGVTMGQNNEQIATALLRLQEDMANVLHRLHTLEVLTVSQSRSQSPRQEGFSSLTHKFIKFWKYLWWPFPFSPITAALMTFWPLVAHWLVQLYLQRRRRKIC
ncbi:acyl-CoA-binding domain-containing protein 5A-like isoform X1 [Gadus chalcogrammus]|uniref:acyl-CoA-binding domain-containing protein 5A-like isoform X1 n=1 Tax=Gadus chalcogrammus TaxID=1042646 RepID=UPI0024C476CF|nr:acyl-CoA-binding domain-containing protein 5A-like isoform X1 [Gadus chalcogrammus]